VVDDRAPGDPDAPPRQGGSILSAGVPAAPVEWVVPGSAPGGVAEIGQGIVLAGLWTRIAAFLIDFFILGCLALIISLAATTLIADQSTARLVAVLISAPLAVSYFAVSWIGPWAATPGQRLAGMRVVDAVTLLQIGPTRAFGRSLALGSAFDLLSFAAPIGRFIDALAIIWLFVLLASVMFNDRRQGIHDRWTRTLVVRPAKAGSLPLTLGCFLIVLMILLTPVVIAWVAGPTLRQLVEQLPTTTQP
jgi:uncharacterized RDD family membrane protein YckC